MGGKKNIVIVKTCATELQSQVQDGGKVVIQHGPAIGEMEQMVSR